MDWYGDTPYYLMIGNIKIDLDEDGWVKKHYMRFTEPALWVLVDKVTMHHSLIMPVHPGEAGWYVKRHVHFFDISMEPPVSGHMAAYGFGKWRTDGQRQEIWLLPDGVVVGGDDVGDVAMLLMQVPDVANITAPEPEVVWATSGAAPIPST